MVYQQQTTASKATKPKQRSWDIKQYGNLLYCFFLINHFLSAEIKSKINNYLLKS